VERLHAVPAGPDAPTASGWQRSRTSRPPSTTGRRSARS
jgi:hypothetical protein